MECVRVRGSHRTTHATLRRHRSGGTVQQITGRRRKRERCFHGDVFPGTRPPVSLMPSSLSRSGHGCSRTLMVSRRTHTCGGRRTRRLLSAADDAASPTASIRVRRPQRLADLEPHALLRSVTSPNVCSDVDKGRGSLSSLVTSGIDHV